VTWIPTESEKDAACRLLAGLLQAPEDEQLDVLALLANLWCCHQNVKRGRRLERAG
jgi:hypothetical protein